jgi:hypothetical protein
MKYFKRANIYKNATGSNKFNPETKEAHSYDWWCYVKDFDGVMVFNDYSYSNTTAKHQSSMRSLLEDLGYRVGDFWTIECPKGLNDLESGVEYYNFRISELEALISKKGTRKTANEKRQALINQYRTKIEMIRKLQVISSEEAA